MTNQEIISMGKELLHKLGMKSEMERITRIIGLNDFESKETEETMWLALMGVVLQREGEARIMAVTRNDVLLGTELLTLYCTFVRNAGKVVQKANAEISKRRNGH